MSGIRGSAVIVLFAAMLFACDKAAVLKPDLGTTIGKSSNADLADLIISAGTLSPAFTAANTSYSASVPYATSSLTVSASPADTKATLSGDNGIARHLSVGTNAFSITVTAEDGTSTKNYLITITRAVAVGADIIDSTYVPANYSLVWFDEFDGTGLPDTGKWFFETWGNSIGWGNGEIQQYKVNDLDNAFLADGKLNIVAKKEPVSGTIWDGSDYVAHTYDYSSARLSTHPHARTYGFIEVRAKIPGIAGTWPAIWLVGLTGWPRCGEIDIMEQWGADATIGGNFHVELNHGNPDLIKHYGIADLFTSFHNYQVLWTPSKVTIMVDGNVVNTYEKNAALSSSDPVAQWPFDTPENLILNLAIQGKGVWVDDVKFPVTFQIEYVRWYQED